MDVLLLNLNDYINEQGQEKKYLARQVWVPPLGLLYIGQVLVDNGYSVKVYDQNTSGATNSAILDYIKKLNPKIVGFSVLIDNFYTVKDIVTKLKAWNPNVITVAGNYFATFFPDNLMKEIDFDFCIRGEGEYSFLHLVNHLLEKKTDLKGIAGLSYHENGVIKSNPLPEKLVNLDELPIPNRKLIDFSYGLSGKSSSVLSSRGCPYRCRFCTFSMVMGKTWRPRSIKSVIEEIQLLKEQGNKTIVFVDDNFTLNKKRVFQLTAEIRKNRLDDLRFLAVCRADNADMNVLRALVSSNFVQILFGIESGTQRILDYYRKGITIEQIKQAIKTTKKVGLELIYGSFVLGAPDETLSEVLNTLKFARKLDLTISIFQILYANPTSPIYQELVEKGLYTPRADDWKKVFKIPDIAPTSVPTKILEDKIGESICELLNKTGTVKFILNALRTKFHMNAIIHSIQKG